MTEIAQVDHRSFKKRLLTSFLWALAIGSVHFGYQIYMSVYDYGPPYVDPIHQEIQNPAFYLAFGTMAVAFLASFPIAFMGSSNHLDRRALLGALTAAMIIACAIGYFSIQNALYLNSEEMFVDAQTGEIHLLEVFSIFYPYFFISFFPAALLILSIIVMDARHRQRA